MAKMKIAPKDRPKVLMACARMLATLKLDPARAELIWTFAESYLKLTAEEMNQYQRELARLAPEFGYTTYPPHLAFGRASYGRGKLRCLAVESIRAHW